MAYGVHDMLYQGPHIFYTSGFCYESHEDDALLSEKKYLLSFSILCCCWCYEAFQTDGCVIGDVDADVVEGHGPLFSN